MKMTSGDKARRVRAIILFFIFGPVVLLTVAGLIWHRRSGGGTKEEEAALTEWLCVPTTLTDVEFIRPGTKSYFGLRAASLQTGETFLFCPEILSRPLPPSADSDSPFSSVRGLSSFDPEFADSFANSFPEGGKAGRRLEWLIPDLYLKPGESESLDRIVRGGTTLGFRSRLAADIRFRIGRIHLIREKDFFDRTVSDYRRPAKRFGAEIIAELSGTDHGFDHERSSEAAPFRQVAEFASNPNEFILEGGKGSFVHSERDSLLSLEFRPEGIAATEPARLAIFYAGTDDSKTDPKSVSNRADREGGAVGEGVNAEDGTRSVKDSPPFRLFWGFDCRYCPIPSRLAAPFVPLFQDCGDSSWLTGTMTSIPVSDFAAGTQSRRILLKDVALQNGALASLLKRVTTTRIEGNLARLVIQNGEILDGVFIGNGRIHLTKGGFHKDFLVRFQKEFGLNFEPRHTLANHFPDDMIPFDQVIFDFDFLTDGVKIHASDASPTGTAGVYESSGFRFKFFLPTDGEKTVSYQRLLSTLSDGSDHSFWTPFYRDALNHLPTGP